MLTLSKSATLSSTQIPAESQPPVPTAEILLMAKSRKNPDESPHILMPRVVKLSNVAPRTSGLLLAPIDSPMPNRLLTDVAETS